MKKVLFASSAMVLAGSVAYAEVSINGNGRFGLNYDESQSQETQLSYRLRFNFNASVETDAGVTFGGRIRLQYDNGDNLIGAVVTSSTFTTTGGGTGTSTFLTAQDNGLSELNAAYLFAEAAGFRLEVGNANTAFDSMSTIYNSEIGFLDRSFGDPGGNYLSYRSAPYVNTSDRTGIFVSYVVGEFVARASYLDPDQTDVNPFTNPADEEEWSVSVDYSFGGFSVGAGWVENAGFVDGDTVAAVVGEYSISDIANVGLQYFYYEDFGADANRVTLYGNYQFDAIQVLGYVAWDDNNAFQNEFAAGIGANYDLGGARLAGAVHYSYDEDVVADIGVAFSF
jgi:outer membrane protein OmpU